MLDWDRINLENYYSLYITKQIKTERTIKPAVITNMTSVLVRPKIIVYLGILQIPNCKAMSTVVSEPIAVKVLRQTGLSHVLFGEK